MVSGTLVRGPNLPVDINGNPIPVLGHVHGVGVPSSSHRLGNIAASAQSTYALSEGGVYEISVVDAADEENGTAPNVLIKPGVSGVTIASVDPTATDAFLVLTSKVGPFQITMLKGQTHLAVGNMASGKTITVFARRLV